MNHTDLIQFTKDKEQMNDEKCRDILRKIFKNTSEAYRYEDRIEDCAALQYAIDMLSARILDNLHEKSIRDQVAACFRKENTDGSKV